MNHRVSRLFLCLAVLLSAPMLFAAEGDVVPKPGTFPAPGAGVYLAGELVSVDHVNRRGAIRFVGDNEENRYHGAPSHQFAMLPYGTMWFHGAPAELRDIPIGTLLHGTFLLPPEGDATLPPPDKNVTKYVSKNTQALMIEDDFSFYQRQGQAWQIVSVDAVTGLLKLKSIGQPAANGLKGEQTFTFDASTRIWKGRQIADIKDLAPEQVVQVNLTWAPDWQNGQFQVADVWIDKESRDVAAGVQRQIHIRHQRTRWLAGWVDNVEHQPGGKGIVTVTLFGGMDPSLYDEVRAQAKGNNSASLAAAEWTLRTWWQNHDCKIGPVVDVKDLPNPPPGSSGVQLRIQIYELLEGFRPGRIVRFRPHDWPSVKLPPEERVKNMDDR
jgi:hypothetical protein